MDFLSYRRRNTNVVNIGNIPMGGSFPIRIQTMTNTSTADINGSVEQIMRINKAGADFVRLTVPSLKDVESIKRITDMLRSQKCNIPIVADIHFNPAIAMAVVPFVQKVRINPGNYTDRKQFRIIDYTDAQYQEELDFLKSEFKKLLDICRKYGTAIRIGTNHGSLSDRIMSRYGDTPLGMAESAMDFLRICQQESFDQVVISMKASNTRTMVYATRILVNKMEAEGMQFPVHLGVTEAGEGEDGRIRSAVGIGALLSDGIGDTIRVSLTEDPEAELPVARKIVDYILKRRNHSRVPEFGKIPVDLFNYNKKVSRAIGIIGGTHPPVVIQSMQKSSETITGNLPADFYFTSDGTGSRYLVSEREKEDSKSVKFIDWPEYVKTKGDNALVRAIEFEATELLNDKISVLNEDKSVVIILKSDNVNCFADYRSAIFRIINMGCSAPVIIKKEYDEPELEDFQLKASCDLGGLFIDGLAEGIWLENKSITDIQLVLNTAFSILQFSRVRTTKTEYISCPSCGRTLFNLQATTKKIRERTSHLKGLKIGIMGCIVNGPGEMADADYGYVGTGKGMVTLYKEKNVIKRNVPEDEAVEELITLIKENGDWKDPV